MEFRFERANKKNSQFQHQKEVGEITVDEDPINVNDKLASLSKDMILFLRKVKETCKRLGILNAVRFLFKQF